MKLKSRLPKKRWTYPRIVYHYCRSEHGIHVLSDLEIKITPPAEFNDPFEFNPHVSDKFGAKMELVKAKAPGAFKQFLARHEEIKAEHKRVAAGRCAVFCASRAKEDILLWGLYGDSQKGIAIGFDTAAFAKAFAHVVGRKFWPVHYTNRRTVMPFGIYTQGQQRHLDRLNLMARTKSDLWKYEDEFRLFFDLTNYTPRVDGERRLFFEKIPAAVISHVIIGAKSSEESERRIRVILRAKQFKHVRFQRATLHPRKFKIDLEPLAL